MDGRRFTADTSKTEHRVGRAMDVLRVNNKMFVLMIGIGAIPHQIGGVDVCPPFFISCQSGL
jgi:hypothetical protein